MLSLHIVRGPLDEDLNEAILDGYTRLSSATVSPPNFRRWMQQSPAGPALHALLKNHNGKIAGHCCLHPFPMTAAGQRVTVAKAEYFFVKEDSRRDPVQGHEGSLKPAALLLLELLYRSARELGWSRYLASAPAQVAPLHTLAGLRKIGIPLTECLLTLRPWQATTLTNPLLKLSQGHRLALAAAGTAQRAFWAFREKSSSHVRTVSADAPASVDATDHRICLSSEADFLAWRYSPPEYVRLQAEASNDLGIIAKRGLANEYLRVCQSSYCSDARTLKPMLKALITTALQENALGVRWAVYDDSGSANRVVSLLQKMAFLCVRRERTIYLHGLSPAELRSTAWRFQ